MRWNWMVFVRNKALFIPLHVGISFFLFLFTMHRALAVQLIEIKLFLANTILYLKIHFVFNYNFVELTLQVKYFSLTLTTWYVLCVYVWVWFACANSIITSHRFVSFSIHFHLIMLFRIQITWNDSLFLRCLCLSIICSLPSFDVVLRRSTSMRL